MSFQPTQILAMSVTKTVEDWRCILVEPQPFLDELRNALAEQRAAEDHRTNHIALRHADVHARGDSIARAAKKQSRKLSGRRSSKQNRFLAAADATNHRDEGAFECPDCPKTFHKEQHLNIHRAKMHKQPTAFPTFAHAAESDSL